MKRFTTLILAISITVFVLIPGWISVIQELRRR